jgi:uncharacterized protein YoxC
MNIIRMSTNAPILKLILEKLSVIESDVSELKKDMSGVKADIKELKTDVQTLKTDVQTLKTDVQTLKTDVQILKTDVHNLKQVVNRIQSNIKNESDIQEYMYSNQLKSYLMDRFKGDIITTVLFGNFYIPNATQELTDIDGCVIQKTLPMTVKRNGLNVVVDKSCVYFIEAKHSMTKPILEKKLNQFVVILQTMNGIYSRKNYSKSSTSFRNMIVLHSLEDYPQEIHFLLSSDKMSPDVIKLVTCITSGSLTEDVYNDLLFEYIYNHPYVKDIINDKKPSQQVKEAIGKIKSLNDIQTLISEPFMKNYKLRFEELLVPYDNYKNVATHLQGKLGFISKSEIQLPEDIVKYGFNSKNILLTNSQRNYVKSVGFNVA